MFKSTGFTDYNELTMKVMLVIIIISMLLLFCGFMYNAITKGPKPELNSELDLESDAKPYQNIENFSAVSGGDFIGKKESIKIVQDKNNDDKKTLPIDKAIFEIISKKSDADATIYMNGINSNPNSNSNQDLRNLIQHIVSNREETCGNKVLINRIYNYTRFTNPKNKRYHMYNLYKKYYTIPLEADDYDKPLLITAEKNKNILEKDDEDIRYEYIPSVSRAMCSDRLFLEDNTYCEKDTDFLKDKGKIIKSRYFLLIRTDPFLFVHTSDGVINNGNLLSNTSYENNISFESLNKRIKNKISRLAKLIWLEHRQESVADGVQFLLDRNKDILLYQTFGLDIVVKNGEPYIINIEASPILNSFVYNNAMMLIKNMSIDAKDMFGL